MAVNILVAQNKKVGADPKEYLNTIADAIEAPRGIHKK